MTPTDPYTHHPHPPEELENEDVAHEHSDVNIQAILKFAVGMIVVTAAAFLSMWVLFRVLNAQAASNDPEVSPLAVPAGQLPPVPRLQTNEPAGLEKFRSMETKTLENYGWVDQSAGVARIPIDEAKKKLLEHGLPARQSAGGPAEGTHAPAMAESSGGRNIK